jgi:hypothetical protein
MESESDIFYNCSEESTIFYPCKEKAVSFYPFVRNYYPKDPKETYDENSKGKFTFVRNYYPKETYEENIKGKFTFKIEFKKMNLLRNYR